MPFPEDDPDAYNLGPAPDDSAPIIDPLLELPDFVFHVTPDQHAILTEATRQSGEPLANGYVSCHPDPYTHWAALCIKLDSISSLAGFLVAPQHLSWIQSLTSQPLTIHLGTVTPPHSWIEQRIHVPEVVLASLIQALQQMPANGDLFQLHAEGLPRLTDHLTQAYPGMALQLRNFDRTPFAQRIERYTESESDEV